MQNQTNAKHFSNPEKIFKSAKNFLEKRNPKEDSSKTTIRKVKKKKQKKNFKATIQFLQG